MSGTDDFEIDSGIDLEMEESYDARDGNDYEIGNDNNGGSDIARTAKISLIAGIIIILLALGVANISGRYSDKDRNEGMKGISYANEETGDTDEDIKSSLENDIDSNNGIKRIQEGEKDDFDSTVSSAGALSQTREGTSPLGESSWVQFKQDENIVLDQSNEAIFTITNIKNVAKIVNDKNDMIIKSIIYGSISGISGTYEIEMPYDKAMYLKDGTEFKIEYRYNIKNGTRLVGEIKY